MTMFGTFRHALIFGAAIAILGISERIATASVIPISFTTTGVFSAGMPPGLTYTPTSFSGVTAPDGSLALPDLGTFTAGAVTENTDFNGFLFTLGFNFSLPDGVIGTVEFVGDLHGQLHPNGGSGVQVHFNPNNSQVVTYSGSSSSGSFTLTVDNVRGVDVGSPQTATGSITGGVDPAAATPEPGSFVLLGTALIAISWALRRRILKQNLVIVPALERRRP